MKIFFDKQDFDAIAKCKKAKLEDKLSIMGDMIRLNALNTIMCARSGHIGASFSAVEVLTVLYHAVMKLDPSDPKKRDRDIFVLSKGHAAAALYSVLASRGFFPAGRLATFRRLGGLEGHAEISAPGVETNTGSLGMGISKGKGFAWGMKKDKLKNSVFVLVGDGELQEGQNWEAIQSAGHWRLDNFYLLVDRNRVQTDMLVEKVIDISPLAEKLKAFGWAVAEVDGHDVGQILRILKKFEKLKGKPKAILLNTIKGKGVSFMEHPHALRTSGGFYGWHDKLPYGEPYAKAWNEIIERIKRKLSIFRIKIPLPDFQPDLGERPAGKKNESLVNAFSKVLLGLGKESSVVVLDADLAESCGLREFQLSFPEKFIEVGIAEQDMVSMAGGLALAGKLPIVNTYAAFLTSRANEQIFNNCSEGSKIVYVGHMAGILPAKPGKSHQGIRDIALLRNIPNLLLCAPACGAELEKIFKFLVREYEGPSYLRIEHNTPRKPISFEIKKLHIGRGSKISEGKEVAILGYGPTMMAEAMIAKEELSRDGIKPRIVEIPWLNRVDEEWLRHITDGIDLVVCLENHSATGGLSEEVQRIIGRVQVIGADGYGRSGEADEVLRYFKMDGKSIAEKVRRWRGK